MFEAFIPSQAHSHSQGTSFWPAHAKWRKLSPEERRIGRENYLSARQLSAGERRKLKQKWEEYSSLPEEEKEKHKKRASGRPARLPLPAAPTAPARLSAAQLPAWQSGSPAPRWIRSQESENNAAAKP
ncbi:MAG: DUF3106 domain-containing protein [Candidatus Accumulibacter sp.]|nr:DUF3106 domain-containing protein [Accumulibacter sp.]